VQVGSRCGPTELYQVKDSVSAAGKGAVQRLPTVSQGADLRLTVHIDEIYVLSAKYGLVTLDQPLEPYEQTLKTMSTKARREWAEQVCRQIRSRHGADLSGRVYEFHTGTEYRQYLMPLLAQAGAQLEYPVVV